MDMRSRNAKHVMQPWKITKHTSKPHKLFVVRTQKVREELYAQLFFHPKQEREKPYSRRNGTFFSSSNFFY